ncbi:MAG: SixA phosphatase family protein [Bradymonadia bacterium]|jgi:phosphohistidine phosphatase
MDLYLIRHAAAVERTEWPGPDESRPLTEEGRERFVRAVSGLARLGVTFDLVLHSPWLRAAQTAELLAPLTRGGRVLTPDLAESPDTHVVESLLMSAAARGSVAWVGHEPWMSALAAMLIQPAPEHEGFESAARFAWKKGGVAWLSALSARPGAFELRAFLPPNVLRALGD